jgi:hypothetical protein
MPDTGLAGHIFLDRDGLTELSYPKLQAMESAGVEECLPEPW